MKDKGARVPFFLFFGHGTHGNHGKGKTEQSVVLARLQVRNKSYHQTQKTLPTNLYCPNPKISIRNQTHPSIMSF